MNGAASFSVSPLAASDYEDWLPLWTAYLTFYKTTVTEDISRLTFDRLLSDSEPMGAFIARDTNGNAIGIVHWISHRSTWTAGNYCYLQDLFTSEDARGKGVGRALIEAVYDAARKLACARVYWLTHETNTQAMALYDNVADRPGFLQYRKVL